MAKSNSKKGGAKFATNILRFSPPEIGRRNGKTRVLILQGPVGPFYKKLQNHLISNDIDAWRVCFNAGDMFYASKSNRIRFFSGKHEWKAWLDAVLSSHQFDCIVLFGSERPAHKIARAVATQFEIPVLSMEEGYVRPGYITIEDNGNNASSPLAGKLPPEDFTLPQGDDVAVAYSSARQMTGYGAIYYILYSLFGFGGQREMFHRSMPLIPEAYFWVRNLFRRVSGGEKNFAIVQKLLEHWSGRYFLVPLQVAADANMRQSALGWSSVRLMSESIKSFAKTAPVDTRLVFKIHPMERGHNNLTPLIHSTAETWGVKDRVDVIETGSLGLLARHSAGMITINSTSGLSAIYHGIPLMILGKALFANPKLAICANGDPDFDAFWTSNHVADNQLRRRYIPWLKQQALVPGDYYSTDGMQVACQSVLEKIKNRKFVAPAMKSSKDKSIKLG